MDKGVHFHIPVDDMDRAKKFYADSFEWNITDTGIEHDYQFVITTPTDENGIMKEHDAINAGLYKRERAEESPLIIINVASVNEYIKKVESTGGTVVTPVSLFGDSGFFALVSDTESNIIGFFQDLA